MPNNTVLLIDDDQDIRDVMRLFLEDAGYRVLCAEEGGEGLLLLQTAPTAPALIFLDLRMPGVNGWEFHEAQAQDPRASAIPTVVITGDRTALAGDLTWATGVLTKPFDVDQVLSYASRYAGSPAA
jgi:CheY-like chemotaxis protein